MHLLSLGHQTIALCSILWKIRRKMSTLGLRGLNLLLMFHQISHDQLILLPTQFSKQGGYQITAELLDSAATGVFALNDELAFDYIAD